jgi:hypothetical protein
MKKPTFGDVVRFLTFAMVAGLFMVWLVFGSTTVQKQNAAILKGVQVQLHTALEGIEDNSQISADVAHALVCVLKIQPDARVTQNVSRCLVKYGLKRAPHDKP